MPTLSSGRLRQLYAKIESSFGTAPTFGATDAKRVTSCVPSFDVQALRLSQERRTDPSQRAAFRGRIVAKFTANALMYPSGVLNTLPELDLLLKLGFGAAPSNITLAASVLTAASTPAEAAPTTTAFAITDFTGLVVNQMVVINLSTGAYAGNHIRQVTAIAAAAGSSPKKLITVSPALPTAPILTDTVKGMITYGPATAATPSSMDLGYYDASFATRELLGCVVDKMMFSFDSNLEPRVEFSGPAQRPVASPQSQPGSFTTVGADSGIPSGLFGGFYYGSTAFQIEKMGAEWVNGYDVYNEAYGTSYATLAYLKGKRAVKITVDAKVSSDTLLWTPAIAPGPTAPSESSLFLQTGVIAGQIWGVYCPRVLILNTPDIPDGDETTNATYTMLALATNGNDEMFLGMA